MIASTTYTNTTDIGGPTVDYDDLGPIIYYDVEYDASSNVAFYDDYELLLKYWSLLDREVLREQGAIARAPWPMPEPPLIRPCRIVNRMMRCNQIGRKTVSVN